VAAVVGAALLWWLGTWVRRSDPAAERPGESAAPAGWDRRRFMTATGGAAGLAVVAGVGARAIENRRIEDLRAAAPDTLPALAPPSIGDADITSAAPEVPADATLSPITPFITPNDDFYLIDTALSVPRIRLDTWAVDIDGMVDRPLRLTYDDLLARPQVERIITIACVSNEVGGNLIGTARWQGVLLADLLDEAGVQPDAEQVFGTSVDGWTCGFPVAAAFDGRDAMIAVGMNGEPLPLRHGFPARVIVPGLYGYVSATKWLARLQLTRWSEQVGYWVPRGWAAEAPVKTQSRIDVPRRGDTVPAGRTAIAGVAWAQQRGVTKVEISIDEGEWVEARLGSDVTIDTWRQWAYDWDATPGEHIVRVRATDGTGETQTEEVARPDPDGATGYHTRTVVVEG
jgi:DMSO/TMAO reductase YedYZ molybdopterin-dependent catalytic subunit